MLVQSTKWWTNWTSRAPLIIFIHYSQVQHTVFEYIQNWSNCSVFQGELFSGGIIPTTYNTYIQQNLQSQVFILFPTRFSLFLSEEVSSLITKGEAMRVKHGFHCVHSICKCSNWGGLYFRWGSHNMTGNPELIWIHPDSSKSTKFWNQFDIEAKLCNDAQLAQNFAQRISPLSPRNMLPVYSVLVIWHRTPESDNI